MEHLYKIGVNRNNSRIWLEGSKLLKSGFVNKTPIYRHFYSWDCLVISKEQHSEATRHTVSGTSIRPVINFNGKWVTTFCNPFTHYRATFNQTEIVLVFVKYQ